MVEIDRRHRALICFAWPTDNGRSFSVPRKIPGLVRLNTCLHISSTCMFTLAVLALVLLTHAVCFGAFH